jgi:hypothetical protein
VRFDGLQLRMSQEARLKRLSPRANVLADAVVVPLVSGVSQGGSPRAGPSITETLLAMLREIAPAEPVPST